MSNTSGGDLWIDDKAILESINRIENGINALANNVELQGQKMRNVFENAMAGGVDAFVKKLQEAKSMLDAMPEAKVSIATAGAEQSVTTLSASLSELVQQMAKVTESTGKMAENSSALAKTFGAGTNEVSTFRDMVASMAQPLNDSSLSLRKLVDNMGTLSKNDYFKAMAQTEGEALDKLRKDSNGLFEALSRLSALSAQKNTLGISQDEARELEKRIREIQKAILDISKGKEAGRQKTLEELIKDSEKADQSVMQLRKTYAGLVEYLYNSPLGSKEWDQAAVAVMNLGEKMESASLKAKLLPMPMEKFQNALRRLDYGQLEMLEKELAKATESEGTAANVAEAYRQKLALVAQQMQAVRDGIAGMGFDLETLTQAWQKNDQSVNSLRNTFGQLKKMLAEDTWVRDGSGLLSPATDGLAESIQGCIAKMREYERAQQDVLAGAKQLGEAALRKASGDGAIAGMNAVELERLAADLKLAMRYLTGGSGEWSKYKDTLQKVQAQQQKLNDLIGESARRLRDTAKAAGAAVEGSMASLHRKIRELSESMGKAQLGSKGWHDSAADVAKMSKELADMQRQTKMATESADNFRKSLSGLGVGELAKMLSELQQMQSQTEKGGSAWMHYAQRISDTMERLRVMQGEYSKVKNSADSLHAALGRFASYTSDKVFGTAGWESAARLASEYAGRVEKVDRQTQLLTMSTESFKARLATLREKSAFASMLADLNAVKAELVANGASVAHVDERVRMLRQAYREMQEEASRPKTRSLDEIGLSIKANQNNLAALRNDYRELQTLAASADYGSKAFYDAATVANSLASRIKALEQNERTLSEPMEQFKRTIANLNQDGLRSVFSQINILRREAIAAGADSRTLDVYREKLVEIYEAYRHVGTAATQTKGVDAMALIEQAAEKVKQSLQSQIAMQERAAQGAESNLAKEKNALVALQQELARTTKLRDSLMATGRSAEHKDVKAYQDQIDILSQRITAAKNNIMTMEGYIGKARNTIQTLTDALNQPFTPKSLEAFRAELKQLGRGDLEQIVRQLEQMQTQMSRTPEGKLSAKFYEIREYAKEANAELERTRRLMSEANGAAYSWAGDAAKMANVGLNANSVKTLEELRALHQALYAEISKTENLSGAAGQKLVSAYQAVGNKVQEVEEKIKGVNRAVQQKPEVGATRTFDAMAKSALSADATVQTLNQDLSDVRQRMQNLQMDGQFRWAGEFWEAQNALAAIVARMEDFRRATEYQNQAIATQVDKIAYLNREMQGSGSAAMGRWDGGKGYQEIMASIKATVTTAEQLKKTISDIQEVMSKTAKYDSTGTVTKEWRQLVNLLGNAQKRLREYNEEKTRGGRGPATFDDAMRVAQTAQTYNRLTTAVKMLQEVMNRTNPNDPKWAQLNVQLAQTQKRLDSLQDKMKGINAQSQAMGSSFGQLQTLIVQAFSLQAIGGFLKKMVETHAQMHLQNIALRAIIQNKDKADQIFGQVQQMALQSPFTIMQLTKYVKQVAAYRIEADKLVDTTKMLADVSAGLGVDMQRLVLAFGQIKAANFLRATEVRQLTEAGLNVYGELSQYFTELEGRVVSTADVMKRVHDRLVKFTDVEAIFKRITSAGGTFYDMQKKQADSVHGMLQRINDAYTVMMDQIGQGHQGTIKTVLSGIREMLGAWRSFVPVIKGAIVWASLFYAAKGMGALIMGFQNLKEATHAVAVALALCTKQQRKFNAAQLWSGWGAIVAIIGAAVMAIYQFATKTTELEDKLKMMSDEAIEDADKAVGRLRLLVSTLNDSTKGYSEHAAALEEVRRSYRGIFTAQELELQNIKGLAANWEEAEQRMRAYYQGELEAKERQAIEENWSKEVQKIMQDMAENLSQVGIEGYDAATAKTLLEPFVEQIKKGEMTAKAALKKWREALLSFYAVAPAQRGHLDNLLANARVYKNGLEDLNKQLDIYNERMAKATRPVIGVANVQQQAIQRVLKENEEKLKEAERLLNAIHAMNVDRGEGHENGKFLNEDGSYYDEMAEKAVNSLNKVLEQLGIVKRETNLTGQQARELAKDFLSIEEALRRWGDESDEFVKTTQGPLELLSRNLGEILDSTSAWLGKLFDRRSAERWHRDVTVVLKDVGREIAEARGESVDILSQIDFASHTNAAKTLKGEYDKWADILERAKIIEQSITDEMLKQETLEHLMAGMTKEQIEHRMETLRLILEAVGGSLDKKTSGGKGKDPWAERLTLLKKVNAEYEKLLKYYDAAEAKRRIVESFGDAAMEVFDGIGNYGDIASWLGFDKSSTAGMIKDLLQTWQIAEDARKKMQEDAGALVAEVDIHAQEDALERLKEEVDEMFNNLDLTKTLADLGMNVNLTYMVGGRPTTLAQVRKGIEDAYNKAKIDGHLGEDAAKAYADWIKKIDDLTNKQMLERLKAYRQYLLESMSERVRLELKAQEEINKLQNNRDITDETRDMAIAQVRRKLAEDLDKEAWNRFKGTDMYIDMFSESAVRSKESIDFMLEQLERLRGSLNNLPADQVRAIIKEMDKLRAQRNEMSPLEAIAENAGPALNYLRHRKELEEEYMENTLSEQEAFDRKIKSEEEYAAALERQANAQAEVEKAWREVEDANAGADFDAANARLEAAQAEMAAIEKQVSDAARARRDSERAYENARKNTQESATQVHNGRAAADGLVKGIAGAKERLQAMRLAFDSMTSSLDTMGLLSEEAAETWVAIKETIEGTEQLLDGMTKALSGDWFGAAMAGMSALMKITAAFVGLGDKRKQREIERLKGKVEDLGRAYDRLRESMDRAYKRNDYESYARNAEAKLRGEIKAYEEMLKLEESKKKKDKDAIKEYQEKVEDLRKELEDLANEQTKAMGGFGSDTRLEAAEAFVDTWLEAYKETGDGIDALGEKWDEYIESLLKKQAAYRLAGKRMEDFFNQIDAMADAHTELSMREILDRIVEMKGNLLDKANQELKEFFDYFGWNRTGDLLLSDLQKGIQNITEAQAAALESIMNSMRFAEWRQVDLLTELVAATKATYGNTDEGQLAELRGIRAETAEIRSLLASVIRRGGSDGRARVWVGN